MRQSSMRQLFSETSWIVLGKASSFILTLAMIHFLTHQLDVSEYGKLTLALTIFNLATQLIMGALGQGIGRYYSFSLQNGEYQQFIAASIVLLKKSCALIVILGVISIFLTLFIDKHQYIFLLIIIFIFSYIAGLNDIANGLHNLARNRSISVINVLFELILRFPIIILIFAIIDKTAEMVMISYLLTSVIILFLQKKRLHKLEPSINILSEKKNNWESNILKITLPAAFWGVFVWLQQSSDRWALNAFSNITDVAQYAIIYQLGYTTIITGMSILVTLFTPILYQEKQDNHYLISSLIFFVFSVTTIAFITTSLSHAWIMDIIVGQQYQEVGHYLPQMVLAAGFYSAGDIISVKMMSNIKIKLILIIKTITSLIGLIVNILGTYFYGIDGLIYALIFFSIIYFLLFTFAYIIFIYKEKYLNV